jgi:hypothetical protein
MTPQAKKLCDIFSPGVNVIKLFTTAINCHSMVIPSFCDIKLYYLGNYRGMAVNYHVKNLCTAVIYIRILTLENVGTAVNYQGIFITLAPEDNFIKTLCT